MIPVSFVPEYPSGFLAKKLFKRINQQPEKQPMGFVFTDFENTRKGEVIIPRLFFALVFLLPSSSNSSTYLGSKECYNKDE